MVKYSRKYAVNTPFSVDIPFAVNTVFYISLSTGGMDVAFLKETNSLNPV